MSRVREGAESRVLWAGLCWADAAERYCTARLLLQMLNGGDGVRYVGVVFPFTYCDMYIYGIPGLPKIEVEKTKLPCSEACGSR